MISIREFCRYLMLPVCPQQPLNTKTSMSLLQKFCATAVVQQGLILPYPKGFLIFFVINFGYSHLFAGRGEKDVKMETVMATFPPSSGVVGYQPISRALLSARKCMFSGTCMATALLQVCAAEFSQLLPLFLHRRTHVCPSLASPFSTSFLASLCFPCCFSCAHTWASISLSSSAAICLPYMQKLKQMSCVC